MIDALRKQKVTIIAALVVAVIGASLFGISRAAGGASFSLSPDSGSYAVNSTFNVTVYENSSVAVNSIAAELIYDSTALTLNSVNTSGSPFTTCPSGASNAYGSGSIKISCALLGGSVTGTSKTVATLNFTVIKGSGSTDISFSVNSHIVNASDYSDEYASVGTTVVGASYSLTTPAPTCAAGQTGTYPNCVTPPPSGSIKSSSKTNPDPKTSPVGSNSSTAPAASSPSASSQAADPAAPIPVTAANDSDQTYLVAIKILDGDYKTVERAKVTIGSQTVVSDKTGIASFTGLKAGTHKVTVKSDKGEVKGEVTVNNQKTSAQLQTFTLKVKRKNILLLMFEIAAGMIILTALAGGLWYWLRMRKKNILPPPTTTHIDQPAPEPTTVITPNNTPPSDKPNPETPGSN